MKKNSAPLFQELFLEQGVIKEQVYHALRNAIVEGRLPPGTKIPSTRGLSEMMSISRNSVIAGYDRLLDEGYIQTRKGAGTFVTPSLPDRSISGLYPESQQGDELPADGQLNADIVSVRGLWSGDVEGREMNRTKLDNAPTNRGLEPC